MLLHGIKDDNIELASAFDCFDELVKLGADAYIMNPPYNAKPINIPEEYKKKWGKSKNAKEDPTKGMVFVQLVSNAVKKRNEDLKKNGMKAETSKLAVLLPVAAARGTSEILRQTKEELLKDNTLEAVMTLPDDIFHPGASVNSCCMVFKLGESHVKPDGTVNKTFFGYFKNDGHKKKKNYGRVELFDENKKSIWKKTEDEWLSLYRNKEVKPGLSAMAKVTADDEWLCEEYMDTDYNNLYSDMWQKEVQNLAAYEIKTKKIENTSKMDVSKWKEFKVGTLFPKRKVKHYSSTPDCEGHIPFITSTSENNGVSAMVDVDEVLSGNAITVSTNGSCFDCFYQENDFAISNDVEVLYGKHLNKYTALFIIPLLKQEKKKYSYGRKAKNNKVFDTIIKLPVVHGEDGNPVKVDGSFLPDWKFMEEYIKKYNCIN